MACVILRHQPELKIPLDPPELPCGALDHYKDVYLTIAVPRPWPGCEDSYIFRHGCWPGYPPDLPYQPWENPPILYPAFDRDCENFFIFRLDDRLFSQPPGRYEGVIYHHHRPIAWLDIDLRDQDWLPKEIVILEPAKRRHCDP